MPVSASNRTAQGTIYYAFAVGNRVKIWDGTRWRLNVLTELSLSLTVTAGKNYDVYLVDSSGVLSLGLSAAWTNDTTRVDALSSVDGVTIMSGTNRLWVGAIRASGTNTTEDSSAKRFVWNAYNQVERDLVNSNLASHAGNSTSRKWNAADTFVEWINGSAQYVPAAISGAMKAATAGNTHVIFTGIDGSVAVVPALGGYAGNYNTQFNYVGVGGGKVHAAGYHYYFACETSGAATGNFDSVYLNGSLWC